MNRKKLSQDYFQQEDVLFLSQDLLGKFLFSKIDHAITGGMIIETEAYRAPEDKASHAYNNRRTKRNEMMYSQGGVAYVYLCYGMHHLFNVVTNKKNIPHAILIRAIIPTHGMEKILKRRRKKRADKTLSNGPGTLSQALGINVKHNGLTLKNTLWIEDKGIKLSEKEIIRSPRIGVDYAKEHASLPWRFRIHPNTLKKGKTQ